MNLTIDKTMLPAARREAEAKDAAYDQHRISDEPRVNPATSEYAAMFDGLDAEEEIAASFSTVCTSGHRALLWVCITLAVVFGAAVAGHFLATKGML
jgi:hypothetical protein